MIPDLSITIINHETPELLKDCLQSIYNTQGRLRLEIFVVNNTPDKDDRICTQLARFPGVHLIQNPAPLGFAANQNQMLRQATGRYLMPLNSDTVIQPGALQELVACMERRPRVGIAGPKLVYAGGKLQPSGRNFPNMFTHFMEASGLWQLLKGNRIAGRWYYLCSPHDSVRQVDWLTGACLIVRAEAAREVGFYNEELFPGLYGEDLEWCWRMKRAGWQIMFDPNAVVVHLENQSPLNERVVQIYRGFYTFCAAYYSKTQQRSIRIATILALMPKWLLSRNARARKIYAKLMQLPMPVVQARTGTAKNGG